MIIPGPIKTANEVSMHAAHLIDSDGSPTPTALIPFCAYQTNMTLLGQRIPGLNYTVCSQFQPTLVAGQLCYSFNHSSLGQIRSQEGTEYGLVLILDPGRYEKEIGNQVQYDQDPTSSLRLKPHSGDSLHSFWIYTNTLNRAGSYSINRAGAYGLSNLKKMTGTDDFLKQSDDKKKCVIQTLEDCNSGRYLENVLKKCGCIPWILSRALSKKV